MLLVCLVGCNKSPVQQSIESANNETIVSSEERSTEETTEVPTEAPVEKVAMKAVKRPRQKILSLRWWRLQAQRVKK